jgi:hypothetical protein
VAFTSRLQGGDDTLYVADMGTHYREVTEFSGHEAPPTLRDVS